MCLVGSGGTVGAGLERGHARGDRQNTAGLDHFHGSPAKSYSFSEQWVPQYVQTHAEKGLGTAHADRC